MRSLRIGAFALAFALLIVACSQGMTMQEYFSEMTKISGTQKQQGDDLQSAADKEISAAADEATQLELIKSFFADSLKVAQTALASVQDLSPPSDVEAEHKAFADAFQTLVGDLEEASASIADASSGADVQAVIQDVGTKIEQDSSKFDAACADLQKAADDNKTEADLNCGGGSSSGSGDSGATPSPSP
ncbi:MAG: hypothetical protein MUP92_02765 [Actinobacteria bacterium]|nr:hypothetical protein [Actinomycetota bacterium]